MTKIFYALVVLPFLAIAQTPSSAENYIWTKTYKVPTANGVDITGGGSVSAADKTQTITYYDGLGRPKQINNIQQSPFGNDIVAHIPYDAFGRQQKEYLPLYSGTNNGAYIDNNTVINSIGTQYASQYGQSNVHSEKKFEPSPLNRILSQSAPGNDWAMGGGHELRFDNNTNETSDVRLFIASTVWNDSLKVYDISLTDAGFYTIGMLYKNISKNENWNGGTDNTTEEFTDKQGRMILKRTYGESSTVGGSANQKHDTYYVYDVHGNLTYVIPPLADNPLDSNQMANLCYQYKYDHRNRQVEKKLPHKQWEFIVYDKLNRVVATGPAFSPFTNSVAPNNVGWLITKYDIFNRPIITGWMASATVTAAGRNILQTTRNTDTTLSDSKISGSNVVNGISTRYSISAWPTGTSSYHILTVNYYDNYDTGITFTPAIAYTIPTITPQPVYYNNTVKPIGLPTVNLVRVLRATTNYELDKSYTLYDKKSRVVRTFSNNYLGGYTRIDSQIDFSGKTIHSDTRHKRLATDTELKTTDFFTYSAQDRLITHRHQVNNNAVELLTENTYNHLGLLQYKKVGNTASAPLQKVDYVFNIRGWLTGINNGNFNTELDASERDLFAFKVNYNTIEDETAYPGTRLYNKNISETYWRTSSDNVQRKYSYKYDALNRLRSAVYQKPGTSTPMTNSYDEHVWYDKNGNITTLARNGDFDSASQSLEIDYLIYKYDTNSNRLLRVTDGAGEYSASGFKDGINTGDDFGYDLNGNMIYDLNKGITAINPIKYNHLNLPTEVVTSISPLQKINYLYDAHGVKVQKVITSGASVTTTDYLNGFQYKNGVLQFFPTAEGYVNYDSEVYKYVYNHLDHQGNVRLSYTADLSSPNGLAIMEQNHYYPFGMKHTKYNVTVLKLRGSHPEVALIPDYKYKYNAKEFQNELGLNWYDYGARNYDPAIGRWMNIDPLAEVSRRWSPYTYCYNNPVRFTDIRLIPLGSY